MIARRIRVPMNGAKAKLGLLAALLSLAGAGEAKALDPDQLRTLPESDGPLQVQIGFHVFDITDISEKDETIDFNGAVYMQWNDPRQAYDPADFGYSAEDFPSGETSRSPPPALSGGVRRPRGFSRVATTRQIRERYRRSTDQLHGNRRVARRDHGLRGSLPS